MIKHILTLIWNKRKSNILIFLEILIAFFILYFVFAFVIDKMRMYTTPLGFEYENVWEVSLAIQNDADSTEVAVMKETLRRELLAKPQIEEISFGLFITPFSYSMWSSGSDDNGFNIWAANTIVDENYDKTLGLNIVEGRFFEQSDFDAKYPPVVVNQLFVDAYFDGESIVDSVYIIGGEERKIIGVVDHYKYRGEFDPEYEMTIMLQDYRDKESGVFHIKLADGVDKTFEAELNQTIASITKTNDFIIQYLDNNRQRKSRRTWIPIVALLSICTFLILNVALGLFGVLWYTISKRRGEIGLRRAIGATRSAINNQFIGEILLLVLLAILVAAVFAIQIPLLDVIDTEDVNFYYALAASSGIILVIVLICTLYPSWQASQIHPAVALHEE